MGLLTEHRFEEAVCQYGDELQQEPNDAALWADYSKALLCLGRFPEALAGYQRANTLANLRDFGCRDPFLEHAGTVQWLLGDRTAAIRTLTEAVDGIQRGTIKYADQAGGATPGLLLWYMGVTARCDAAVAHVEKYLRKLAKKPKIQYWPGPAVQFVLGGAAFEQMRDADVQMAGLDLPGLLGKAGEDLFTRRHAVQALFYQAAKHRHDGLEDECLSTMRICAGLKNPVIELEWFLARAEARA